MLIAIVYLLLHFVRLFEPTLRRVKVQLINKKHFIIYKIEMFQFEFLKSIQSRSHYDF